MEPLKKFFVEKLFLKKISKRNFFTKNFCVAKVFLRKKISKGNFFPWGLGKKNRAQPQRINGLFLWDRHH